MMGLGLAAARRCVCLLLTLLSAAGAYALLPAEVDGSFITGSGLNGIANDAVLQPDGQLVLVGQFTSYNGTAATRLVRINRNGGIDTTFATGAGANAEVFTLALQSDGKYLIGGFFNSYDGEAINRLARINSNGSLDTGFMTGTGPTGGRVRAVVVQPDGKIIVAGDFTAYDGAAAGRVVRLNSDGSRDTTFDTGVAADGAIRTMALQADGRVLLGGDFTSYDTIAVNRLVRVLADGSLDTSFDAGLAANASVQDIAVLPDGLILVSGSFTGFAGTALDGVVRLDSDGAVDVTFNAGGTGANAAVNVLRLLADGRILMGGNFTAFNGTVIHRMARLHADGSLDTGFASGTGLNATPWAMEVQQDGRVLIAGQFTLYQDSNRNRLLRIGMGDSDSDGIEDGTDNCIAIMNADQLDTDSDGLGNACDYDDDNDTVPDVGDAFPLDNMQWGDVDGDGVNGLIDNCPAVSNSGQLDTDTDGIGNACDDDDDNDDVPDSSDVFPLDGGEWLDTDGDGIGNNADPDDDNDTWLDGEDCTPLLAYLDCTLAGDGSVTTDIGNTDQQANAVVRLAGGDLLAAGYHANGSGKQFLLLRYDSNGEFDSNFGKGGVVITAIGDGDGVINAVVEQADGKIVAAGYSLNGSHNDMALARYHTDGSLDTTFGAGGILLAALGATDDVATSMIQQADGRLLVAGYASNGSNLDVALMRFNSDGSIDSGFGNGGKVMSGVGSGADRAAALLQQPDGKFVVAGYASNGANLDMAILRYHSNGSLDTSFSGDGKQFTPVGAGDDIATGLLRQFDGKLVVTGSVRSGAYLNVALLRYNTDGSLDSTFDGDGKVTTAVSAFDDAANAVIQQADSKLVVTGFSSNNLNWDIALLRYNSNGSLDTSFSGDGKLLSPVGSGLDAAHALLLQPDGTLVAAGISHNGADNDVALLRYVIKRDVDGDGVYDTADWFPADPAKAANTDPDGDGIADPLDNCASLSNANQLDTDGDGIGNVCDIDDDGDGVVDELDAFPLDATETLDKDADGVGDNADNCVDVVNSNQQNLDGDAQGDACDVYPLDDLLLLERNGSVAKQALGTALAAGDINNDNLVDLLVAAPLASAINNYGILRKKAGSVLVVNGRNNALLETFSGTFANQQFGAAVAVVKDQDDDGISDLVVGEPLADVIQTVAGKAALLKDAGRVVLYSGADGQQIRVLLNGVAAGERWGAAVAVADINGDNEPDLAVGLPMKFALAKSGGQVRVYGGLGDTLLYVRGGDQAGERFGSAIAMDKDYLYIGSPFRDTYSVVAGVLVKLVDAGRVSVFPVQAGVGGALLTLDGMVKKDMFGAAIAAAEADINGDGRNDWAVGIPLADTMAKDAGKVQLYSGLDTLPVIEINGEQAGAAFGGAVSLQGDVNRDDIKDLAVGSAKFDVSTVISGKSKLLKDAGRVEVLSGSALQ